MRVASTEAGSSVRCRCGATVEIPSLSRLRALARDNPEVEQRHRVAQRVRPTGDNPHAPAWMVCGAILVLFASCLSVASVIRPEDALEVRLTAAAVRLMALPISICGTLLFGRSFRRSWLMCALCSPFGVIGLAVLFFAPARR